LGQEHPEGKRLTDYQKCIRTGDIEAVGDPSHLTFFEMLGNWSLGDYFKDGAIRMSFEFLTSPQWLNIPVEKLGVTVFTGDEVVERDEESASVWKSLGIPEKRIAYLPREDNWWGPAGATGPCGPDSEMFYYTKGNPADCPESGDQCKPGCPCGGWLEIWNDVFMQYNKDAEGRYIPLYRTCVDTGMGIERTITILNGKASVYDTEIFAGIIESIVGTVETEHARSLQHGGRSLHYGADPDADRSIRIIADHIRSAVFVLGDPKAVTPSNLGAGYVLRRLIRRAVRHGYKLGIGGAADDAASTDAPASDSWLCRVAQAVIDSFAGPYPELLEHRPFIMDELEKEGAKFSQTLRKGEHEFEKLLPNLLKNPQKVRSGRLAFKLYDTYGYPIELTEELAAESGLTVNREEFDEAFKKHQELSRAQTQAFKGGLADHSEVTTAYHTATHLLQAALRWVLGPHIAQKGSNITAERMRFDFSHGAPMTPEQVKEVEELVNGAIKADLPVTMAVMSLDEAKAAGATALFGEKYESQVKVYTIGGPGSGGEGSLFFSREVCGGPHVEHSGLLGHFKIQKEQSSSAGVRRIRAILEP
jgi:alanyl-tRNA synthetase